MLDEYKNFFLFTYAKMLLHKRLGIKRLLSPYAIPFYPTIEIRQVETEIRSKMVQDTKNITKEKIASALQVDIKNIIFNQETKQTEEKWIKVNKGVQKDLLQKDVQEAPTETESSESNKYNTLKEENQDGEELPSKKNEQ